MSHAATTVFPTAVVAESTPINGPKSFPPNSDGSHPEQ